MKDEQKVCAFALEGCICQNLLSSAIRGLLSSLNLNSQKEDGLSSDDANLMRETLQNMLGDAESKGSSAGGSAKTTEV